MQGPSETAHFYPKFLCRPSTQASWSRRERRMLSAGSVRASPHTWRTRPWRSPTLGQQRQWEPSEISGSHQRRERSGSDPRDSRVARSAQAGWAGLASLALPPSLGPPSHPTCPAGAPHGDSGLQQAIGFLPNRELQYFFFFFPSGRIISAPFSSHDNLVWLGRVGGHILLHTAPPPLNPPLRAWLPFIFKIF